MQSAARESRRRFLTRVGGAAAALAAGGGRAAAGGTPADERITAVTLIRGLEGREAELKQHLLSLAAPTRGEAGCVAYDLYESPEKKRDFMRLEIWTSLEALEAHKRTPHIRASFEKRQREGWTTEITVWKRVPE